MKLTKEKSERIRRVLHGVARAYRGKLRVVFRGRAYKRMSFMAGPFEYYRNEKTGKTLIRGRYYAVCKAAGIVDQVQRLNRALSDAEATMARVRRFLGATA